MKIALLTPDYPPEPGSGEIGLYTRSHGRALAALGHEVHVFVGSSGPRSTVSRDGELSLTRFHGKGPFQRFARQLAAFRLPVLQKHLIGGANALAALRRALRQGGFDVVEVAEHGCEAALLALCLDLPAVVRLHGPGAGMSGLEESGAMDRLLTRTLVRLGIQGAAALSASSRWLLDRARAHAKLRVPVAVIPDGVDVTRFDGEPLEDLCSRFGIPEKAVKFFCADRLGDPRTAALLRSLVPATLARWEDAVFILAGEDPLQCIQGEILPALHEGRLAERLFCLGRLDPDKLRACLMQFDVLVHPSTGESCPRLVLWAMAASAAIVAPSCDSGIPELIRQEVDGILVSGCDGYQAALDRLAADAALRRRLGESARRRVESRYSIRNTALESLEFYAFALGLERESGPVARTLAPLGPENWFDAWWAARTSRVPPGMAEGEGGAPAFAALSLAEIRFVECVLARIYWDTEAASDTQETAFLTALNRLYLERAVALKQAGQGEVHGEGVRLRFPAPDHPLFADGLAHHFLDESWRVAETSGFRSWLDGVVTAPGFAEEAAGRVALRRLAVQAARISPSRPSYELLRTIYRTPATHEDVLRQDREFIEKSGAKDFEAELNALGLHTPLERPAVFAVARRERPNVSEAPGVVVLIPSYNHEAYIAGAIRSVLGQSRPPARVLVVDDCSRDGTLAAARAIADPRLEIRVNSQNLGLGASICAALEGIEEEFVALLNSDDLFHPERIERVLSAAVDPRIQVVATGVSPMDGQGRLLSLAGASAVDHGPMVHDWLRWYEGLVRTLEDPGEWSALDALLRRNHLLTSSNLVCRTEFLRRTAPEFRGLKYCVDWMLFLLAALEDGLAFLPQKLVGYRLHQDNTIWFEQGRRPLFVMEENQVAARVIHLLAGKLAAERGAAAASGELARILTEHVARNGDADGYALFLQEVIARIGAPDPGAPETGEFLERIAAFTSKALDRRTVENIVAELHFPANELFWLAQHRGNLLVDRHVAEGQLQLSRNLQQRVEWLEQEIGKLRGRIEDVWAMRLRAEEDRAALQARIARMEGEFSSLNQEKDSLHQARTSLEEELDLLGRMMAEAEQASLKRLEALEAEKARLVQELGRLVEELALLTRALQVEKERYEFARARADEEAQLRGRDREEFLRKEAWLHQAWREERYALLREGRASGADRELRLGRFFLRNLQLGPALNGMRRLALRGGRFLVRARALAAAPPARVFFSLPAEFPPRERPFLARQALWLAGRGIRVGFLAWGRTGARTVGLPGPIISVFRNRRLQAADLRSFARSGTAPTDPGLRDPGRACTLAREARSRGAALFVSGAEGALDTLGAARLLGLPLCLLVNDADLAYLQDLEGGARLLLEAQMIWAESEAIGAGLEALAGAPLPGLAVHPLLVEPSGKRRTGADILVVAAGPVSYRADLETLVQALESAGPGVRLEILGSPEESAAGEEAAFWLRQRIAARPPELAVSWKEDPSPLDLEARLRTADILYGAGIGPDGAGSRTLPAAVLAGLGAGIPVIASRPQPLLRDGKEALLVDPCDVPALAEALNRLARDPALRADMGAAGRGRYEELDRNADDVLNRMRIFVPGSH